MSRPGALRSRVAVFVCTTLIISLLSPAFADPGPVPTTDGRLRVAVGTCSDGSTSTVANAAETLERALRKSLADQKRVQLVGPEGEADRILSARIASLTTENRQPARIQIIAESTDPVTGNVAYRAAVTAEGAVRPGEELVARVDRAIGAAASQIASQVARAETIRPHVIGTPRPGVVILDAGAGDGITVGSELEVLRDGEVVAGVRIEQVAENTSTGRLHDVTPGAQVRAGDDVHVKSLAGAQDQATSKKGKRKNRTATYVGILLAAGLLVALLSGGGGGGGNNQLTLLATPTSIPADGTSQATITATLKDARGRPLRDGVMVNFETTLGLITPAQVPLTDGQAQAMLTSETTPGRAVVRARAEGLQARASVMFTQEGGQLPAAALSVITDANEIPADGQSTTTVTAVVADANGNPVADGTEVRFTSSLGLISPGSVVTTGGIAQATLRSTTEAGTATIIARSGALVDRTRVRFVASGDSANRTLFLTRSGDSIPANGQSTVEIYATVRNASNNPVADGTFVQFTSSAGTIFPARAATADGIATATLRSDTTPGTAIIRASIGQLRARTTVEFVGGGGGTGVASIFLTRNPAEVPGDGVSTSQIVATVRDANNNPVEDGTSVVFTTNRGLIAPSIALSTNGQASATLQSEPTSTDLTATVTAVAGSQQAVTTVKFTGTGAGPTQISLIADRTNLPADGASTAHLRATLIDDSARPVGGANVIFAATAGRLQPVGGSGWQQQITVRTNNQGIAEALLRSTAVPNTSTVTARAPTVTPDVASVTIAFTSLVIANVVADPTSVPVGGNKSATVTATVVDSIGNPAPNGTVVEFAILNQAELGGASITGSASTVDGKATAIFRSGTRAGTARISVTVPAAGAVNDQTIIGVTADAPKYLTVVTDKGVTSAMVISEATAVNVTALVSDRFSNPVEDGTAVYFYVTPRNRGVITGVATTRGGFALAKLYPARVVGPVSIVASTTGAGGVSIDNSAHPVPVHMGGPPVSVVITSPRAADTSDVAPYQLYTEADQKITVRLRDRSGGPADPLSQVTFRVSRGTVTPDPVGISSPLAGTATATFRSDQPTPAGSHDKIEAQSGNRVSAPLYIFLTVNPGV